MTNAESFNDQPPPAPEPPPDSGEDNAGEPVTTWDLLYGVLFEPAAALRQVALRRPVLTSALLLLALRLMSVAVTWMLPMPAELQAGSALPPDLGGLPPEFGAMMQRIWPAITSSMGTFGILVAFVVWFISAAVYQLISQLFGGRGDGPGLLAALAFAELPTAFSAPIAVIVWLTGLPPFVSGLALLAIAAWTTVLTVIAIREAMRLSTGRAIAVFVIPIGAFLAIMIAFVVAVVIAFAGAAG